MQKLLSLKCKNLTQVKWFKSPFLSVIIGLVISSASLHSHAINIEHVNIGRIAVENQSLQSQQTAGRLALAQVFVKLSGNESVIEEPEISKAVENYEQFLISSSFFQQSQALIFEATFNQAKIENLLLASGLSVWASLRPTSLLWLAIENNDKQKVMLSQLSSTKNTQQLKLKSFARGVEIVIPLGDLEDSINLPVYDIWNQYISKIKDSSNRYATDYFISATVQAYNQQQATIDLADSAIFYDRNDKNIDENVIQFDEESIEEPAVQIDDLNNNEAFNQIDETNTSLLSSEEPIDTLSVIPPLGLPKAFVKKELMVDTVVPLGTTHKLDYLIAHVNPSVSRKVETGRVFGDSEEAVILKVVDVYANMLAKEFALSTPNEGDSQTILLAFDGINTLQKYVRLMSLIRSIPAIENIRLIEQSGTKAIFEIKQNMSINQLKSILTLDNRISTEPTSVATALSFRWLGQ